jgi:hypothetical protein
MTGKPTLPALIIRGALDDLATISELADEPEVVRDVAGGASARLERALEELEGQSGDEYAERIRTDDDFAARAAEAYRRGC